MTFIGKAPNSADFEQSKGLGGTEGRDENEGGHPSKKRQCYQGNFSP